MLGTKWSGYPPPNTPRIPTRRWFTHSHTVGLLSSFPSSCHSAGLNFLCYSLPKTPGIQNSDSPKRRATPVPSIFPLWSSSQPTFIGSITVRCLINWSKTHNLVSAVENLNLKTIGQQFCFLIGMKANSDKPRKNCCLPSPIFNNYCFCCIYLIYPPFSNCFLFTEIL